MSVQIKKKSTVKIGVPTASMPDIIFQLLIFFMVTTVLRQYSGLTVELPDARMIEKLPSKRYVSTIWVDSNNRVVMDDVSVPEGKLQELRQIAYKKLQDTQGRLIVSLKVDKKAEMGKVTDVQQELRQANCLRVNYSTLPEAG